MTTVRVTVTVGPYATVRAIEQSGLADISYSGIIAETDRHYIYEITGTIDHLGCYLTVCSRGTYCPIHNAWIRATDPREGSE